MMLHMHMYIYIYVCVYVYLFCVRLDGRDLYVLSVVINCMNVVFSESVIAGSED